MSRSLPNYASVAYYNANNHFRGTRTITRAILATNRIEPYDILGKTHLRVKTISISLHSFQFVWGRPRVSSWSILNCLSYLSSFFQPFDFLLSFTRSCNRYFVFCYSISVEYDYKYRIQLHPFSKFPNVISLIEF